MGEAKDFKFGGQIARQAYKPKMQKWVKMGVAYATWPTIIILGPLYSSGMGKARDFKFGVHIDRHAYKPKKSKVRSKGAWHTQCE